MTLVQEIAALTVALGGLSGAIYAAMRWRKSDARQDRRDDRSEVVDDKAVDTLTEVIDTLRGELERTQVQLSRNDAYTQQLASAMTSMTAQIITQNSNMLVLKGDADRMVNLLLKVKQTQDRMLKDGQLVDRLVDIKTDFLKFDLLK